MENEFEKERLLILRGFEIAYEKMIEFKKRKGTPVVISENGKVKFLPADKAPAKVSYKAS